MHNARVDRNDPNIIVFVVIFCRIDGLNKNCYLNNGGRRVPLQRKFHDCKTMTTVTFLLSPRHSNKIKYELCYGSYGNVTFK